MLSLVAQRVKNLPAMQETQDCSLGQESSGEGDVYSLQYTCVKNFIARGAWGLQYMGSQRTGHRGTRDQIANICRIIEKNKRIPEKHLFLLY